MTNGSRVRTNERSQVIVTNLSLFDLACMAPLSRSRDRKGAVELESSPVTYLITFACYGCHLHGSESGSVDREHNVHGTPLLEVDLARVAAEGNEWIRLLITWIRTVAMPCWKRFR